MLRLAAILAGAVLSLGSSIAAGRLIFPRTPLPHPVRFLNGAILFSSCVFALLACGLGYPAAFLLLSGLLLALASRSHSACTPPLPRMTWFFCVILTAYALLYVVYALAPEIQPDAIGYHLRLVSEYARLHAFSNRIAFYDMLPQGMEMLFVPAFSLGGAAAAKLVHLGFLCATIPLIREIARETGLSDRTGSVAAALLFLAPVSGVAGTSAYTDAGLLCATCALTCLLLKWTREPDPALLLCAGMNAGFCYTIKPTFGIITVAAFAFTAVRSRRFLPPISFAALAAAVTLPWIARAWWLTADPVAPFLSAWFPNPVSTPALERNLTAAFSAWRPGFPWRTALLDYTIRGGNQGLLGPAFLMLPLALFSLRKKAGRWLLATSAILAIPFILNTGTRFLLTAIAPAALALAEVSTGPAGIAIVALQAVASAPPILALYEGKHEWRLGNPPLRAAFGLTPEDVYLRQSIPGFAVTGLINQNTRPRARILALASLPEAYIQREVLIYWQSVGAQNFTDALDFANMSQGTRARLLSWRWTRGEYRALRFTALSDVRLVETQFHQAQSQPQSWKNLAPGRSVSIDAPNGLTGADLLIWPGDQARENTEALAVSGLWESISPSAVRAPHIVDLRRDATAYIRRSGCHYILLPVSGNPVAKLGADMLLNSSDWGIEPIGHSGNMWLFHILPDLL
jgi:hypothetical protein